MERSFRRSRHVYRYGLLPRFLRKKVMRWHTWHPVKTVNGMQITRYENTKTLRKKWSLLAEGKELAKIEGYNSNEVSFYIASIENMADDKKGLAYFPILLEAMIEYLKRNGVIYLTALAIPGLEKILLERYGFRESTQDIVDELKFVGTRQKRGTLIPMEKRIA